MENLAANPNDKSESGIFLPIEIYKNPPENDASINDLEDICYERVELLRKIENVGDYQNDEKQKGTISQYLNSTKINYTRSTDEQKARECLNNDIISHFMLRLAFSKDEDSISWFLLQESKLIKYRLIEREKDAERIIHEFGKDYKTVILNDIQRDEVKNFIASTIKNVTNLKKEMKNLKDSKIALFPFEEVSSLIGHRGYYLEKGFVYIPNTKLSEIASTYFRKYLSEQMIKAKKTRAEMCNDERIANILNAAAALRLSSGYENTKNQTGNLKINEIDKYCKESYPPCMRILHTSLRTIHHLKHYGRLQYGLFLKGIGFELEDSLKFWKSEFCHKMTAEKFEKEYAYNIRHSFGKEGKRADYTPWSCSKILQLSSPGNDEYHGCPFKLYTEENVKKILKQYGIIDKFIEEILKIKREYNYGICCRRLYEILHEGAVIENVGNHPNSFFIESRKFKESMQEVKQDIKIPNDVKEEKSNN